MARAMGIILVGKKKKEGERGVALCCVSIQVDGRPVPGGPNNWVSSRR